MKVEERKRGLAGDFRLEQQEQEQMWNVIKTGKFIDIDIVEIMLPNNDSRNLYIKEPCK
jgi:hypothetical protein